MPLPSKVITLSSGTLPFDVSSTGNAVAFVVQNQQYYTLLAVSGLKQSGATLVLDASTDGGNTWAPATFRPADSATAISSTTTDGTYYVANGAATHFQWRPSPAGVGLITVAMAGNADLVNVRIVEGGSVGGGGGSGGGANPAQDGTDATGVTAPAGAVGIRGWLSGIFAGVGTPTDAAWSSGAGTVVAILKQISSTLSLAKLKTTVVDMLPAGTNALGSVGANQLGQWFESPFQPIPGATSGLTAGPTATTTPLALGTYTASTYRIRNAASSASPVAWRLNTATPGTAAVMPVAASTAGTGGTVGDKTIDPGGVEVFTLTAAQQTSWAAGTLYLSAITPASGSATVFVTPGTGGA